MDIRGRVSRFLLKRILCVQVKAPDIFWAGSEYGGFYVVPLKGLQRGIVFSFGIGEDISFDQRLMERYEGVMVYGFDPTPKSCRWVEEHCGGLERFRFFPYGIAASDGRKPFYLPKNRNHVSGSLVKNGELRRKIEVPFLSIRSVMRETKIRKAALLKLDIEGSEIDVVPDILESGFDFAQLCMEVHYRFWGRWKYWKLYRLCRLLNRHGYYLAAVSGSYEELTFIKRKRKAGIF